MLVEVSGVAVQVLAQLDGNFLVGWVVEVPRVLGGPGVRERESVC